MIKDGEVRLEGYSCEPCSDISPNWMYMRSKFGYKLLCEIPPNIQNYQRRMKCDL